MGKKKFGIGVRDALVIVDAQNDFVLRNGKLYVAGIDGESKNLEIIDGVKKIYDKFLNRFTTEDNHPPEHVEFGIFGEHCVAGSEGQEYVAGLLFEYENSINFKKGQDPKVISYSISTSPEFPRQIEILRARGIKRIFLVGFAYTHCVGESAIAYACQGFEVYVIRDLTRSVPPPYGDTDKMKQKLDLYGVKEINLKDIK